MDLYRYYKSQECFDIEQRQIFEKYWLFAGLSTTLTAPDKFLRRQILGRDLVFRRDASGQLTCRHNRCGHRGGPFVLEDFGRRNPVCQYHCWRYDAQGCLVGIPNVREFDEEGKLPHAPVPQVHVREIGAFIFVCLGEADIRLEDQYDVDVFALLEAFSETLGAQYSYTRFDCDYNWKLNFENVIDANHLAFVHSQSFGRIAGKITTAMDELPDSEWFRRDGGRLRHLSFFGAQPHSTGSIKSLSWLSHRHLQYAERWYSECFTSVKDKGGYMALQLFPNCNIGSLNGEMFYMQFYEPTSPQTTRYHSWVAAAEFAPGFEHKLPAVLWGMHHAEKKILDEDRVVLEAVQASLTPGVTQNLGKFDHGVADFRAWLDAHVYASCT